METVIKNFTQRLVSMSDEDLKDGNLITQASITSDGKNRVLIKLVIKSLAEFRKNQEYTLKEIERGLLESFNQERLLYSSASIFLKVDVEYTEESGLDRELYKIKSDQGFFIGDISLISEEVIPKKGDKFGIKEFLGKEIIIFDLGEDFIDELYSESLDTSFYIQNNILGAAPIELIEEADRRKYNYLGSCFELENSELTVKRLGKRFVFSLEDGLGSVYQRFSIDTAVETARE